MNNSDFDSILKTIADQHSTTPEEVKAGICEAITAGMKNSDPAKCNLWRSMGNGAEVPEPEDAVLFLSALTAIRTLGLLAQSGPSTTEQ